MECPILWQKRVEQEIENNPNFEQIERNYRDLELEFHNIYNSAKLHDLGRLKKGQLPNSFIIPKFKDPPNKSKLIFSYLDIFSKCIEGTHMAFLQLKEKIQNLIF